MSSSTFRIKKVCQHCGTVFEAQKVSTKFCKHQCSQRNYKLRAKLAKKGEAELQLTNSLAFQPKVNATSLELIKHKEFLSVTELSKLLNCSRQTIYNIINTGNIKAVNLLSKKTLIRRVDIDQLFENPKTKMNESNTTIEMVNIIEIEKEFNISYNGLSAIIKRNNIETEKRGVYVFVNRTEMKRVLS
ncbi:MAG: helix-turn-helix domain-containing protein [Sphingobacteriales bacterium]|nr:MAG: helix-turn-helix domain-containing protein [Sphingobacteriales bacterium]